jgi:hypothetical protein
VEVEVEVDAGPSARAGEVGLRGEVGELRSGEVGLRGEWLS